MLFDIVWMRGAGIACHWAAGLEVFERRRVEREGAKRG